MWTIILSILSTIGEAFKKLWSYPSMRIPIVAIGVIGIAYGAGKIWLNNHDAKIVAENNKMWQDSIAHGTHRITSDTSWSTHQDSTTNQSKQGTSTSSNWKNSREYKELLAKMKKDSTSQDEALTYFTEPMFAAFEDETSIDSVFYRPVGFPPRLLTLKKTPKPQRIPTITITDQTLVPMPADEYIPFKWFNPRLHGDVFPFTDNGLMAGISASICSYGTGESPKDMILFMPTIGLATETKKVLIGTFGIRWNVAHYIGLIQDTHLILAYTTNKQILVGIGTSL
jgi:hypothetical protein